MQRTAHSDIFTDETNWSILSTLVATAMSFLSSTVKVPSSIESSSSGLKIKRKTRRRRTESLSTSSRTISQEPQDPARSQVAYEVPREKPRRVHRDLPSDSAIAMGDLQPRSKRKSSIVSTSVASSGRTPIRSHHHNVAAPTPAPTTQRQPPVSSQDALRRNLTTSASSTRPSNRKRLDGNQLLGATDSSCRFGRQKIRDNNEDEAHKVSIGAGPEGFSSQEDWLTGRSRNNNPSARAALPSRASKYRNLSAGINKKPLVGVPVTTELPDRPPSRQRHAFPTHLIDANAFDTPNTTARRGGSASASSRKRSNPPVSSPPPDEVTGDRPPSRYMVKANRKKEAVKTPSGALSRRSFIDKSGEFSGNQVHHDPKNDGFADVDESVPPPFRIKVTTDACETTLDSPSSSRSTNSSLKTRNGLRWPSFSNQEQLLRMAVRGSDGSNQTMPADIDAGQSQLQWFGKDDQIDNAHLFETVISMPSPRLALDPDVDIAIEDDLEDSDGQYCSINVLSKQDQHQQEPQQAVENNFPSRRAAAASKLAAPKTTICVTDNPELQWIHSNTNPFFVGSSSSVDYDAMDPETAIEQTPLYSSEDLMTLAATEMTDLHLDDYTALGDASMPIAPPPSTSRSRSLRTSLGKDFLSLFAQH